jgi:DtxR family transcriptional regulator, Mn-dependent transcriptional regulator
MGMELPRIDPAPEPGIPGPGEGGLTESLRLGRRLSESRLSESQEDYVEAIGELEEQLKVVRVKKIAEALDVKMSSVSSALALLAKKKLVNYEKYDYVELTEEGRKIAGFLRRRHAVLKKFLTEVLAVEEESADRDSCGMEHHVSKNTINNLVKFIEYIDSNPVRRRLDLESFKSYLAKETLIFPEEGGG